MKRLINLTTLKLHFSSTCHNKVERQATDQKKKCATIFLKNDVLSKICKEQLQINEKKIKNRKNRQVMHRQLTEDNT